MGDAGGESPQRGEFQRLGVLGDRGVILHEYQRLAPGVGLQFAEVRDHRGRAVEYAEGLGPVQARVLPVFKLVGQFITVIRQLAALFHRHGAFRRQQGGGRLVHDSHQAVVVDQQDADFHVLYDLLVQPLQVVQITGAVAGQLLGAPQAPGYGLDHHGDAEYQCAQQARREQRVGVQDPHEDQPDRVEQQGQHAHRGNQHGQGAIGDQYRTGGRGDDQQDGQAADHAATGIRQQHDGGDVHQEHHEQHLLVAMQSR